MTGSPILTVEDLRVTVRTDEGTAQILDHVSLHLPKGRIFGVVGESGCGKSTLIKAILGILPRRTEVEAGRILLEGENLLSLSEREMTRRVRGRLIGFIPQDPYLALNPVFTVGTQLLEILAAHGLPGDEPGAKLDVARGRRHLVDLMKAVQVPDPEVALARYPHQFSGGQRQRVLIAAALACRPRLILADEPTTALDVTTQLQILKLLKQLARDFDVSMLFVTHDFGVVAQLCDSVSVMYAGQTVETGTTRALLDAPRHPYTRMLIGCHPDRSADLAGIPGQVPSPLKPPPGCRFHPRCPEARDVCRLARPQTVATDPDRSVACVLYNAGAPA